MKVFMCGSDQLSQFAKDRFREFLEEFSPQTTLEIENRVLPQEELYEKLKGVDVLVTWDQPVDEDVFKNSSLKAVCYPSIGYNTCDIAAAKKYGIRVTNVPAYCLEEVSNHVIMLILSLMRKLKTAEKIDQYKWEVVHLGEIKRLSNLNIGIIGLGKIGKKLAQKLSVFTEHIYAYDPNVSEEEMKKYNVKYLELEDLLANSDIISLNCNLNDSSRKLISKREFDLMKKDAIFINTARGEVVDTHALIEAIKEEKIAAFGIDVLDPEPPQEQLKELAKRDNVYITPHMAYFSMDANLDQVRICARDIALILDGEEPINPVV